ncbi:MAG: 50S ribosomal protein L21 [Spirochaetaceae bacterium]|jgi:large subunit ribosomal protein L21|nr:50S ribosomal protein L21 [Spirochaetaceae bacterium]
MYAVVEIKGKQYKAVKGKTLKVDLFSEEAGAALEFDKVLMLSDDKAIKTGSPYVEGAMVKAVVRDVVRDPKVTVLKFKKRKNYEIKRGHKQAYTRIKIEEILGA